LKLEPANAEPKTPVAANARPQVKAPTPELKLEPANAEPKTPVVANATPQAKAPTPELKPKATAEIKPASNTKFNEDAVPAPIKSVNHPESATDKAVNTNEVKTISKEEISRPFKDAAQVRQIETIPTTASKEVTNDVATANVTETIPAHETKPIALHQQQEVDSKNRETSSEDFHVSPDDLERDLLRIIEQDKQTKADIKVEAKPETKAKFEPDLELDIDLSENMSPETSDKNHDNND
jgi:hypothetical protein